MCREGKEQHAMSQAHIASTDCDKEASLGSNSWLELSKGGR